MAPVLVRVTGWYRVDCRLVGLCISFTIGWLNEILWWWWWMYLLSSCQTALTQTVRECYCVPLLQFLDKWQSLANFALQTKSDEECCAFAKELSWWLVSFVLCSLDRLSHFVSTVNRAAPLQICLQRSFGCTVWQRNDRLWGSLKNWTMNF
jgi:hypothetical protein